MNANASDDTVLRRYLLGSLTPEVREGIEQRLFSDDRIFWEHLCLVEDELIENYVEDELDGEEAEQFERCFLCTDERRSKLEFARALKAYVVETQQPVRKTVWQRLQGAVSVPAWAVATAVALLLVLPAGFQFFYAPAERSVVGASDVGAWLSPGLVRGVGGEVQRVQISPGCKLVHLRLEPSDEYPTFRATLHEATGDEIWSQARLTAAGIDGRTAVTLTLPCELLPAGDYYVSLYGVPTGSPSTFSTRPNVGGPPTGTEIGPSASKPPRQDLVPVGKGNFRVLRP